MACNISSFLVIAVKDVEEWGVYPLAAFKTAPDSVQVRIRSLLSDIHQILRDHARSIIAPGRARSADKINCTYSRLLEVIDVPVEVDI
jgi:hypothetical protein